MCTKKLFNNYLYQIEHLMFLRRKEMRMKSEKNSNYIWLSTTYGTFKLSLEEITAIKHSANKVITQVYVLY